MSGAYYGTPERNLAPAIWIHDSYGRWHATRGTAWIEVIVAGPSAELRIRLPLSWQ
jgi:hypothetical protein